MSGRGARPHAKCELIAVGIHDVEVAHAIVAVLRLIEQPGAAS
jgi:hypothetical protein